MVSVRRVRYIWSHDDSGQSTVEYAVVLVAFLAMVLALGAIWHEARSGRLQHIARESVSHNAGDGIGIGLLQDLFSY